MTGHYVRCNTGTCYGGSAPGNNTTYDLVVANNGSTSSGQYEVASGATFWLTGNGQLNSSAGNSPTTFGILKVDTGGTVVHDTANGSVAYRFVPGASNNWNQVLYGTLNDTCTFGSSPTCQTAYRAANNSVINPLLWSSASNSDAAIYRIYGTKISSCGSVSVACVAAESLSNNNGYASGGTIDVQGNLLDTTSGVGTGANGLGSTAQLTFVNNRSINSVAGWFTVGAASQPNPASCTIQNNYFDFQFDGGSDAFGGCHVDGNVFGGEGWRSPSNATFPWTSWSGNVNIGASANDIPIYTPVIDNNYMYQTGVQTTYHMGFNTATANFRLSRIIGDNDQSGSVVEGHCLATASSSSTSANTGIVVDGLAVITRSGGSACSFGGWAQPSAVAAFTLRLDHNGVNGVAGLGWITFVGHGTAYYPTNTFVQSMRANIGYSPTSNGGLMHLDLNQAVNTPASTNMARLVGGNNTFNVSSNTLYNASSAIAFCKPSPFNTSAYAFCNATAGTGVSPVDQAVDPKYIDSTRNIRKWAASLGQANSVTGAMTYFSQCVSVPYCIGQLFTYVRTGYQPTNVALRGVAYDGSITGITGSAGTGWSGVCTVAFTVQDADDIGYGGTGTCTFSGGSPVIRLTNPGLHYRVATPATVVISQTGGSNGTAGSQTVVVSPGDIGPVPMRMIAQVAP